MAKNSIQALAAKAQAQAAKPKIVINPGLPTESVIGGAKRGRPLGSKNKRGSIAALAEKAIEQVKRGRPKGSKNKRKVTVARETDHSLPQLEHSVKMVKRASELLHSIGCVTTHAPSSSNISHAAPRVVTASVPTITTTSSPFLLGSGRRGRPPGSKNKSGKKRGPGRPRGSKNK